MASKIEWTGDTWNPLIGCDKVSAGCKNCYAIKTAWIRQHNPAMAEKYAGVVEKTANGSLNWTGKISMHNASLEKPFRKSQPTVYFVNSMSDLFHKDVPLLFIADVFAVMSLTERHTYQVLTKRIDRAAEVLNSDEFKEALTNACNRLHHEFIKPLEQAVYFHDEVMADYPLPNVWIGTSVEDQKAADERIPYLLQIPAAVRFLSCEPLLDEVNLTGYTSSSIGWVIAGGESGKGARPMHPDWVRLLRDQCNKANIPFFFKQWGEYTPVHDLRCNEPGIKGKQWYTFDPETSVCKVGKKAAGRLLDGQLHDEYPK